MCSVLVEAMASGEGGCSRMAESRKNEGFGLLLSMYEGI